jgi:hypothetical protein
MSSRATRLRDADNLDVAAVVARRLAGEHQRKGRLEKARAYRSLALRNNIRAYELRNGYGPRWSTVLLNLPPLGPAGLQGVLRRC